MNKVLQIGMAMCDNHKNIFLYNVGNTVACEFNIGVEQYKILASGKKWYWTYNRVRAYAGTARIIAEKLQHGDTISFEGMLITERWKRGDGTYRQKTFVNLESIHWIWKKETENYLRMTQDQNIKVFGKKAPPPPEPQEINDNHPLYNECVEELPDWKGL